MFEAICQTSRGTRPFRSPKLQFAIVGQSVDLPERVGQTGSLASPKDKSTTEERVHFPNPIQSQFQGNHLLQYLQKGYLFPKNDYKIFDYHSNPSNFQTSRYSNNRVLWCYQSRNGIYGSGPASGDGHPGYFFVR